MPRTATQLQVVRERRRAAILHAALAVFARHGYAGSSVRVIAQEANIAQGLLYSYFSSKEAVLLAVMEQGMDDVLASFAEADVDANPQARLERLVRSSFALVEEHRDFWRLSYSVRMQPDVLIQLEGPLQKWTTTILTALEYHLAALEIPNSRIEAVLLFAQIDGVAQHYVIDPEHYPLARVIEAIIARFQA